MYRLWIALLAFCAIFTVAGVADIAGTPAAAAQEAASPQEVVDGFYAWYLAYLTPDAQGNFANPLVDRAYRGSPFLTADLIARLDAMLESDEPRLADPILCAQDIPAAFTVEAVEDGAYRVSGLFPAGPETMTAYPLARVQVEAGPTGWLITAIRCEAR